MNAFRDLSATIGRYRRLSSVGSDEERSSERLRRREARFRISKSVDLALMDDAVEAIDSSFKQMCDHEPRGQMASKVPVNLMRDYIIVESRTSQAESPFAAEGVIDCGAVFVGVGGDSTFSPLDPSSDEDDLWTLPDGAPSQPNAVSVEGTTSYTSTCSDNITAKQRHKSGSSLKHVCEKSTPSSTQMASQLAATRAALAEERQRREHLEESLQKLRRRTSRFGSTSSEPGSIADIISAHDVVIAYAEELAQRLATQLDLEGKDYLIEKLRKAHVTDDSAPVEGWLEVSPSLGSREAWREMYITLSSRRLLFFLSTEDYVRHKPCLVIQLDKIITVRNVESDTRGSTKGVRTTSANEQCCIQVSYATEGETKAISTFGETRDPEKLLRIFLDYKESQRTSKILYFRARTCRDKVQWLKRLKARLASCPYTGNAGMAGGALLHCLHNLKGFSSTGD